MRSMNGAAGGSADSRGYPPAGLPLPPGLVQSLGGATGPTPGLPPGSASLAGLGFGGAGGPVVGASGANGGPGGPAELKHHADFLSRLLAATPSYMSEIGNPPPGFFSDWLRRLVSKPSGNSSSSAALGAPGLTFPGGASGTTNAGGSSSSGTTSATSSANVANNNTSLGMGAASSHGQAETEGSLGRTGAQSSRDNVNSSQLDAHIPNKRRKRSRLNDQLPLGEKDSERTSPAGRPPSTTMASASATSPSSQTSSSSPSAAAAAAAAAAAFHPFGPHPFWFFPPFLPNPYMNSAAAAAAAMSMNMGVPFPPGLGPNQPPTSSGGSSGQSSSSAQFLAGTQSPSELFRTDNLNLLSGSITSGTTSSNGRISASAGSSPSLSSINPFVTPSLDAHLPHHLSKLSRSPQESSASSLSQKEKEFAAGSPPMKDASYFSAAAAAAAAASTAGLLLNNKYDNSSQHHSSPQKISNQTPSPHYHNGISHKIPTKSPPGHHSSSKGGSSTNKSSSFSISRLTSPSPSSVPSGGGGSRHYSHQVGHSSHSSGVSYSEKGNSGSGESRKESLLLNTSLTKLSTKSGYGNGTSSNATPGNPSSNSSASASSDSGLCVDLRVSGRIWESSPSGSNSSGGGGPAPGNSSSGRAATPPRPIYTTLSAFRDPSDVNLFGSSSTQVPRFDQHSSYSAPSSSIPGHVPIPPLSLLQAKTGAASYPFPPPPSSAKISSNSSLSTRYVLGNLERIYQKIKPLSGNIPAALSLPTGQKNNNRTVSPEPRKRRRSSSSSSPGKSTSPPVSNDTKPIISNHHSPSRDGSKMDTENKECDGSMINLNPGKKPANKSHNKSTKKPSRKPADGNNGNLSSSDHDDAGVLAKAPPQDDILINSNNKTALSSSSSSSSCSSSDDEHNLAVDDDDDETHNRQYFKNEPDLKLAGVNGENFSLSISLNNNNVEGGKGLSPGKNNNSVDSIISTSPGGVPREFEENGKLQRKSSFDGTDGSSVIDLEVPKIPLVKQDKKKARPSSAKGSSRDCKRAKVKIDSVKMESAGDTSPGEHSISTGAPVDMKYDTVGGDNSSFKQEDDEDDDFVNVLSEPETLDDKI